MSESVIFMTLGAAAVAHLIIAAVFGLFARHRVQYLVLAWVNAIFCATFVAVCPFSHVVFTAQPGMLHPGMMLTLMCACYLQSLYPLSIPMPGFLQWGRMLRYVRPIVLLLAIYVGGRLLGSHIVLIRSFGELTEHLLSGDVLLRLCALSLTFYYIANIFLLPRRLARHANVPPYVVGYCLMLGLSVVFYTYVAIVYDLMLLCAFVVVFTLLNLYLMLRTLEALARQLPLPTVKEVTQEEMEAEDAQSEGEQSDFNEVNLHRFMRINYWMQNHREEWKDSTFGRDRLCLEVGLNRHLLLQSVRSQGFNNVHDYINSFRLTELKRMIARGEVQTLADTLHAGFGTTKTARTCFLKVEGITLDAYLAEHHPA